MQNKIPQSPLWPGKTYKMDPDVEGWEDGVVGWMLGHYKDAYACLAPLGFHRSHQTLGLVRSITEGEGGPTSHITIWVQPHMPGCRARYRLKFRYVYAREAEYDAHKEHTYDRLEDLMEDVVRLIDQD